MFDPGFLKWRYFLYFFPIHLIIIFFFSTPATKVFSAFPQWLLVALLSYAITAIPFALALSSKWITEDGKREFAALILIGMVRGFAILDIGLFLELPQVKPYLLRPLNSSVTFSLSFLVLHFLIGAKKEFNSLFHELYVRNIENRVKQAIPKKNKLIESDIELIETQVREILDPLRQNIEAIAGAELSVEDMNRERLIIQSFIEERLRPLSHELWRKQQINPPKMKYIRFLTKIIFQTKSRFGYAILPSFIFGIVAASTIESFAFAWRHSVLHLSTQLIVLLAFEFCYQTFTQARKYLNVIAIVVCIALPFYVDSLFLTPYREYSSNYAAELVAIGWFLLLSLAFTVAKSQSDYRKELIGILLNDIENSQALDSNSKTAEMYAKYLHGEIQSSLSSTQMQLKQAADSEDLTLGKSAIERLASIMRRDHHDYAVGNAISAVAKFQQIIDSWNGIATVSIDIDDTNISEVALIRVAEVIEELVSNAVRHGGASAISVDVSNIENDIGVIFHDDGKPRKSGKSGMGSSLLNSQVLNLKLVSDSAGNQITFQMAQ